MNKTKLSIFYTVINILFVLTACTHTGTMPEWGSFTSDKTYSYDEKYYALQSVEQAGQLDMIKVAVYSSDTDELISDFFPVRASDFWGVCWESDTYNIWIQSADIGTLCYAHQDAEWVLDEDAERPKDIISKYD